MQLRFNAPCFFSLLKGVLVSFTDKSSAPTQLLDDQVDGNEAIPLGTPVTTTTKRGRSAVFQSSSNRNSTTIDGSRNKLNSLNESSWVVEDLEAQSNDGDHERYKETIPTAPQYGKLYYTGITLGFLIVHIIQTLYTASACPSTNGGTNVQTVIVLSAQTALPSSITTGSS